MVNLCSPERVPVLHALVNPSWHLTAVGAGRLRFQRRHEMGAPQMTFAARTVVTVAGVRPRGAAPPRLFSLGHKPRL